MCALGEVTIVTRTYKNVAALIATLVLAVSTPSNTSAQDKNDLKLCYTTWGQHGGESLPGKGLIPDLVSRVFKHAGYNVFVDIVPWARCINLAKKGQYDLVASGWRGENFDPYFDYLNITLRNDINFIVLKDTPIKSGEISNFHGKIVAYVRDSGGMDAVRENSDIETREVSRMVTMIPILSGGRVDAVITDPESFFLAASKMNPPIDGEFKVLQPPLSTNFNSPLIFKGHPHFKQIQENFDRSFKTLIKDGIYTKLINIHGSQFKFQIPLHAR
jgi:polar amino acid transport system substrate-binding protein